MRTIGRYNIIGSIVAIVVVVLCAASIAMPWYHNWTRQTLVGTTSIWYEDLFYLHGSAFRMQNSPMPGLDEVEPWSSGTINAFMDKVTAMVMLGTIMSILLAILVVLRYRRAALLAGLASVLLLIGSVLVFYAYLGNAIESEYDYVSFFSDTTTSYGPIVTHEVWGPLAGWWLVIVAAIVQCVGLLFVALSEGRR